MKRMRYGKTALLILALGFSVFYGMDVATKGIEQINGPAGGGAAVASAAAAQGAASQERATAAAVKAKAAEKAKPADKPSVQSPQQGAVLETSFVNRLSNRTGDALRRLATGLMLLVTSFFKGLLG